MSQQKLNAFRITVHRKDGTVRRQVVVLAKNKVFAEKMVFICAGDRVVSSTAGPFEELIARLRNFGQPGDKALRSFYRELVSSLKMDPSLESGYKNVITSITNAKLANACLQGLVDAERKSDKGALIEALRGIVPLDHVERLSAVNVSTGDLLSLVQQLADFTNRGVKVRNKLVQALIGPVITVSGAIGASIFIANTQIPQIAGMFAVAKQPLPLPTEILLQLVNILKVFPLASVALAGAPIFAFFGVPRLYEKSPWLQDFVDRLPVFGRLIELMRWSKVLRTISMLSHANQLKWDRVLELTQKTLTHDRTKKFFKAVANTMSLQSIEFYEACLAHEPLLGNTETRWISLLPLGHKSGQTSELLGQIADDYEERIETIMEIMPKLLEYVAIGFAGAIVGLVMLASILPTFRLGAVMH